MSCSHARCIEKEGAGGHLSHRTFLTRQISRNGHLPTHDGLAHRFERTTNMTDHIERYRRRRNKLVHITHT